MANSLFLDGTIGETLKWRLHPLIYTFPTRNPAQDIEKKKAEPKTPHFLSLNPRYCSFELVVGPSYLIRVYD